MRTYLLIGLMMSTLWLSACGQTGPLYLPDDQQQTQ